MFSEAIKEICSTEGKLNKTSGRNCCPLLLKEKSQMSVRVDG
jgi:hypothetical protein